MARNTGTTRIANVENELSILKPLVLEHDKILVRGNGEPSIQERMRNIERYIAEEKEQRKYYFRLTVSIAFTNIAALVIAAAIWIMRIAPILEKITTEYAGL